MAAITTQSISSWSTIRVRSSVWPSSSSPGSLPSSTKPTSSRPYSGCASILRRSSRPTEPAPTISVRRGRMTAGSSQVRTTPRSDGTSTTAKQRNMAASSGEYTIHSLTFSTPWPAIR